jgi:hypothetical protein
VNDLIPLLEVLERVTDGSETGEGDFGYAAKRGDAKPDLATLDTVKDKTATLLGLATEDLKARTENGGVSTAKNQRGSEVLGASQVYVESY